MSLSCVKRWVCTEEGQQISRDGSHEARLLAWLPKDGALVEDIKQNFPTANVALGAALKNKVRIHICTNSIINVQCF